MIYCCINIFHTPSCYAVILHPPRSDSVDDKQFPTCMNLHIRQKIWFWMSVIKAHLLSFKLEKCGVESKLEMSGFHITSELQRTICSG